MQNTPMDKTAVNLVKFWNEIASTIGADTLTMMETSQNGYFLVLICFALITGGGFFWKT